ncbi:MULTISPECIES: M23 family metallopeptidase [unclassified Sphingopyxis]|uniref:M23 family metallopeptidase n=1 Tax=unclassified Sphingopyxis TaxID=2614943 RepID=UPI0028573950|nr:MULTISPECIES: M23 family metallopeptidase [unclassified Sphingopyxis]MDR7061356.1 murein DD-endopeptidase MepM/ murein hydrolase activator NlpD [Sphingopyxis sp. BE235]MDR7181913.1 murein DD-endopeptidase MepM/ murein hydrolase activator NlpD [Sphingopyxis sp. BE249]
MRIGADGLRCGAALGLLIVAAGCVPAAETETRPAPRPAVQPVATPPSPPAPPRAPVRADFTLAGLAEQGAAMVGQAPSDTRALTLDGKAVPLASDGRFLIAFDRDAGTSARLVATLTGGREVQRVIAVAAGRWRLEHINAPYRGSASSDADFERRRPAELAQIAAARNMQVDSDGWRQTFRWPVTGRLSGFFGSQRVYQGKPGSYHSGTDVAVPAGTPFVAPADGVVVLAASAPFTLEGNLLIVDHGMGLSSAFLHCQRLDVRVGDRVVQGQRLGTVGRTGRATGPHMHWGLKWRGARLDPGKLAGPIGG